MAAQQLMAGQLFVVATPIGNLGDISYRAVEILRGVAAVACEDTRQTRRLLDHYGLTTPLVSYHEHNEAARAAELLGRLQAGDDIALVSDAGTPLISDPGYRIVSLAVAAGVRVVPIPGACAAVAALSASGLATDSFRFGGFLPRKSPERKRLLEQMNQEPHLTLVFYESPHRIVASLADIEAVLGNPQVVLGRELTKIHEEFLRGRASEVRASLENRPQILGEFCVVIGRRERVAAFSGDPAAEVARLIESGMDRMEAIKKAARTAGISKRELYRRLER
jgi:16S rRNA (cytidine1402-2'-O)-methyltransferase